MFIKLDLVLPRGLSSLYSIYIKEERPFANVSDRLKFR